MYKVMDVRQKKLWKRVCRVIYLRERSICALFNMLLFYLKLAVNFL